MDLETVCRLGGTNRSGAICKGYISDARKMETLARGRFGAVRHRENPRLPEAIDVVVMGQTMWTLAGVWFVVWLAEWMRR
jgi:hypothetical protein